MPIALKRGVGAMLILSVFAVSSLHVAEAGRPYRWHEFILIPVIVSVISGAVTAEYTANMDWIHRTVKRSVRSSYGWFQGEVLGYYIDQDMATLCGHVGDEDWMSWLWTPDTVERVTFVCTGLTDLPYSA